MLITESDITSAPSDKEIRYILKEVNKIRAKGCRCGRTRMKPVGPLRWSKKLYRSALVHAKDMEVNNYFDHISPKYGKLDDRLFRVKYDWKFMGENIADGQRNLKQVLFDWLRSVTHCKLLMSPHPIEMGLARYQNKWVHHFGAKMPK